MAPQPPRCVRVKATEPKAFQSFSKGFRRPWFNSWELWAVTGGADVALCSWNAVNFPVAFMALVPVPSAGTSPGRNGKHVLASPGAHGAMVTWDFATAIAQTPLHLAQEVVSHFSNIVGLRCAQNSLCPEETFGPAAFPFRKPVQNFRWKFGFLTSLVDNSGTVN